MKTQILVSLLILILSGCSSESAVDINVNELKSACDCKKALLMAKNEIKQLKEEGDNLGEKATESDKERIGNTGKKIEDKINEINEKCINELNPKNITDECDLKELEELHELNVLVR